MIRSLRTLPIRLDKISSTTVEIVSFLEKHPKIQKVIYPLAPSHPQFELAKKQMKAGGGLFSILLETTEVEQVEAFCNKLEHFLLACSWGGYESLVFPMCALESTQNYDNTLQPWNLVRLYIGLEEADLLIKDLENALETVSVVVDT